MSEQRAWPSMGRIIVLETKVVMEDKVEKMVRINLVD
jgi:hypothetical protein